MTKTKHTDGLTRRGLFVKAADAITGAAAVAVGSNLIPDAEAQTQNFKQHNLFDLLSQTEGNPPKPVYEFIGRDGKVVNIAALKKSLEGRLTTVSHGFENCDKLCLFVNYGLAELGKRAKAKGVPMTSIVIAVMPEVDGASQEARDRYVDTLKGVKTPQKTKYGLPQDVIVLYPSRAGKVSKESAKDAAKLSAAMGNLVDMQSPVEHSMAVTLYDSSGKCIAKKIGNTTPTLFANALDAFVDNKHIANGRGGAKR